MVRDGPIKGQQCGRKMAIFYNFNNWKEVRFRKCENWGWFKGLIILSEQPIMIQQIVVCQKFYFKPKINKNYQLTLFGSLLNHQKVAKLENFKTPRFWYSKIHGFDQKFIFDFRKSHFFDKNHNFSTWVSLLRSISIIFEPSKM